MANKKKLDYKQVMGIEITITGNPYGDKVEKLLEFPIHVAKNGNGEYVAYYFDKDMLEAEIDYAKRRSMKLEFTIKNVLLVDCVPSYLSRQDMTFEDFVEDMARSVEIEYDMSGKYSAENKAKRKESGKTYGKNDFNEWGEATRYDCAKVYSINQYRVNGCF